MSAPSEHQHGRREIEVAEASAADAALEQLKPYLKPDKTQAAALVLTRMVSKSHSGPIPSAEELEHLDHVLPGAAGRCFDMAERDQAHRHDIERKIVDREFSLRGRGQALAIVGLLLLLMVVAFMAYLGDTKAAAALGAATIVGVVAIFVTGRRYDAKESSSDAEAEPSAPEPKRLPSSAQRGRNQKRR